MRSPGFTISTISKENILRRYAAASFQRFNYSAPIRRWVHLAFVALPEAGLYTLNAVDLHKLNAVAP
jgi:hypothetical protein